MHASLVNYANSIMKFGKLLSSRTNELNFAGEHDWWFTRKVGNFSSSLEAFSDPIEKGYKSTKLFN
jgi:hypothetical protein